MIYFHTPLLYVINNKYAVYQDRIVINNMSDDRIKVVEEMNLFVGEPQNKTRHLWFNNCIKVNHNNESSPPGLDATFCQSTFRYSQ